VWVMRVFNQELLGSGSRALLILEYPCRLENSEVLMSNDVDCGGAADSFIWAVIGRL
jgi:hypothetical protein